MDPRLLADLTALFHAAFVAFVLFGGFWVLQRPRVAWLHVPAFLWGAGVEIGGFTCPLTHLENHYRRLAFDAGGDLSFTDRYILPLIYPDLWFPGGFPPWGYAAIGIFVLTLNGAIYLRLWRR